MSLTSSDWFNCYEGFDDQFSKYPDPGVGFLFWKLYEGDFPILPDELDCKDFYKYKYFTLSWSDRFFVQIPFKYQKDPSPVSLVSTKGGPMIKFDDVIKLAEHLNENIWFYEK